MVVLVLSTGRCGSTTFARACDHIENYTSAHESGIAQFKDQIAYPDDHIEVDNRLSWFLGRLQKRYGDDAFYVHLKRDRDATARSFTKRYQMGIIEAYRKRIISGGLSLDPMDVCRHYVDTVNSNIESFLRDKTNCMSFRLETAQEDFPEFWDRVGATGDLPSSLREWNRKYNASDPSETPSKTDSGTKDVPSLPMRALKKAGRIARKLPNFLRDA